MVMTILSIASALILFLEALSLLIFFFVLAPSKFFGCKRTQIIVEKFNKPLGIIFISGTLFSLLGVHNFIQILVH